MHNLVEVGMTLLDQQSVFKGTHNAKLSVVLAQNDSTIFEGVEAGDNIAGVYSFLKLQVNLGKYEELLGF